MSEHRAAADLLNDLLDARTPGAGHHFSAHDPALTALVDEFFASDDAPAPPPELASQVWRDLTIVAHHDKHRRPRSRTNVVPFALDAVHEPKGARQRSGSQRGRWALSLLATAALVLLALAGSLLALQGTRLAVERTTESLYLPANSSAIAPVLVMAGTTETWPEADPPLWASLQRIAIDPGEAEDSSQLLGDAAVLFAVESGHLSFDASGPVTVTRGLGNDRTAQVVDPGAASIELDTNDQLFVPAGVTLARRNKRSDPVIMIELRIASMEQMYRPRQVHYQRLMPDKVLNTPPAAPAMLAVHRLELLPGESLATGELPGLQMLAVESGSLELLGGYQLGNQSAAGSDTVAAGNGQAHFDTTTGLANRGTEPTVFLAVTITPAP